METYETRKELGFVGAEVVMARRKTFETDREFDIARADDVLDLEVRELGIKAELLNNSCVLARRQARVLEWRQQACGIKHRKNLPSSDLAPVTTILPEAKISAVVLGSRIRMMTAAKRFGLYSAFLA